MNNESGTSFIIETQRLILRRPTADDADAFMAAFNHAAVIDMFLEKESMLSKEEVLERFASAERREESRSGFERCIYLKDSGKLVGGVSVWVDWEDLKGEVAFWCTPRHQGRGIATEALCALRDWCFAELGLERIYGASAVDNPASARVMEKAGMRLEGVLRHDCRRKDSFVDSRLYAIVRSDWERLGEESRGNT